MARTAFISGPLDASDEYFALHYVQKINAAVDDSDLFVIGPVAGIDTLSLHYLLDTAKIDPKRITVFMAHFEFQNNALRQHFEDLGVNTRSVGDLSATTRDRDAEMTKSSDYDILRYRSEQEAKDLYGSGWWPRISNTEVNERRRAGITSLQYNLNGTVAPITEDDSKGADEEGGPDDGNMGVRSKLKGLLRRR